jgi:hypothetical protein
MQVICSNQDNKFYSIEKTNNFSIVSMYDPNHKDNAGRPAYIVYSVVIPHGYKLNGAITNLLNKFENYFKVECKGFPIPEMFTKIFNEFSLIEVPSLNKLLGTKVGYKEYLSFSEIEEVFNDLEILDFRKVYFCDKAGSSILSNPNYVKVNSLERKYSVDLINYNPHDFQIKINGLPILREQLNIQSSTAKIINLTKYDKIDIIRGGSQIVVSFIANEQNRFELPKPQVATQKYFVIRNLNPKKYRVLVNNIEQPTSNIMGSELRVVITTEHVFVEIIDKSTNKSIQEHDTRIHKTFTMVVNSNDRVEEPKKKSKVVLITILISLVLLAGTGIIGWQLGWFETEKNANATTNEVSKNGTSNVAKAKDSTEGAELINPKGYTVKPGSEAILTSKGLLNTTNNRFYRFFNDKWEFSEKNTPDKWNTVNTADLAVVISKYFSFNTVEQNNKAQEKEKEKVKKDDPKVKIDEKGKDDTKKEKDPCEATCAEIARLVNKSINKKSQDLPIFKADANKVKDSDCDCKGGQSKLKAKLVGL